MLTNEEKNHEKIAQEAKEFVKNNCLSWCNMEHCFKGICEDPEKIKQIQEQQLKENK